jgi:deoxyribodipyrimidine photo-lyase
MEHGGTLVWFRQDLRLRDNPAIHAASARGEAVVPVYVWSPQEEGKWPPGGAQRWWLHESLRSLERGLRDCGSQLTLAVGPALEALLSIAVATGARAVYWNDRHEPAAKAASMMVEAGLRAAGIETRRFNSALLAEPGRVLSGQGQPYRVYSAFQRALWNLDDWGEAVRAPACLKPPSAWPPSVSLDAFGLLPQQTWYRNLAAQWRPGEPGALANLEAFVEKALARYPHNRERPALAGTSRLSPHLHFGELGPRQVWSALAGSERRSVFAGELAWREFAHHLLHFFPHSTDEPLRGEFARFPWRRDRMKLRAWKRGQTGVPLVDAGMRELWATGWMHNRVRMITASFLVKNLLIPWQDSARWFWDTLVDADLAANTLNWQWVAGCGVDAAPYFRIFNPLTQAERFDPDGAYVGRWVPECLDESAGNYPEAIVNLRESRLAALAAFGALRAQG